jgi:hypothetical protein
VKNALSFWQVHASGSEEIDIEKKRPFLTGGGQAVASPASEESVRKAIRPERPEILC